MARKGYTSFPFQGFGKGMNLRDKTDSVDPAECIDCLNVSFSDRGAIQQRDGYAELTTAALTNRVDSLSPYYTSSGTKQLLAGCGTRLEALSASGTVVKSATALSGGPWSFVRFGQPNSEVAYAGNGIDTLRKWNATEWNAPTATIVKQTNPVTEEAGKAMPKARYLAIQSPDNRLVSTGFTTTTGGPNGGVSSPSHVYFSEPGNPEAYQTTSTGTPLGFEQLTPGDGEPITGCIAWKEFVFVFKESKFFVFYGNSTDNEGNVEFNYRKVESGIGLVSPRAICSHRTGVYFLSRQGVYRTTGQEPELISSLIEPLFVGEPSVFYTGGTVAQSKITNAAMTAYNERIYLSFPTEELNNRTLVYDPQFEWWSLFNLPCSELVAFRPGNIEELVFGYASGSNKVGRHSPNYTNDAGAAITSYWRSGWFDLDIADVKKVRATKAWGAGEVQAGVAEDFTENTGKLALLNFSDPTAVLWGGSTWGGAEWSQPRGLIGDERRISARGTAFSVYFLNEILNQDWEVHRLEHLVPNVDDPARIKA